jgi:hypothetical protein
MLEFIIIFCVVASIVWIVSKVRAHDRALENAALDQAWRIVLMTRIMRPGGPMKSASMKTKRGCVSRPKACSS